MRVLFVIQDRSKDVIEICEYRDLEDVLKEYLPSVEYYKMIRYLSGLSNWVGDMGGDKVASIITDENMGITDGVKSRIKRIKRQEKLNNILEKQNG
jgi:hypothetical protein